MTESVIDRENVIKMMFLMALNVRQRNIYQGTVSREEKARRRAKGKVAKASRKRNRGVL